MSTTTTLITLDKSLDLNSLFSLSYNFDMLKQVIEALVLNKETTDNRLKTLEDKLEQKDHQINNLENDLKSQGKYFNKQLFELENIIYKDETDDKNIKTDKEKSDLENIEIIPSSYI